MVGWETDGCLNHAPEPSNNCWCCWAMEAETVKAQREVADCEACRLWVALERIARHQRGSMEGCSLAIEAARQALEQTPKPKAERLAEAVKDAIRWGRRHDEHCYPETVRVARSLSTALGVPMEDV